MGQPHAHTDVTGGSICDRARRRNASVASSNAGPADNGDGSRAGNQTRNAVPGDARPGLEGKEAGTSFVSSPICSVADMDRSNASTADSTLEANGNAGRSA